jgi:hypothetical protein
MSREPFGPMDRELSIIYRCSAAPRLTCVICPRSRGDPNSCRTQPVSGGSALLTRSATARFLARGESRSLSASYLCDLRSIVIGS